VVARDAALLGRAWRHSFPQTRLSEDLRLACIVIATRRRGVPLSLRELARRVSMDHNGVATACKSISGGLRRLGFQVPRIPVQELEAYLRARADDVPSVEELAGRFRAAPEAIRRVLARIGASAKRPSPLALATTESGPANGPAGTTALLDRDGMTSSPVLTPEPPSGRHDPRRPDINSKHPEPGGWHLG
jgi:hypothetical protein